MRIRTLLVLTLAVAGLAWGMWAWWTHRAAAARQMAQWQARQAIEATDAALDRRHDFARQTIPLADFAELLGEIGGLQVDLDRPAIEGRAQGVELPGVSLVVPSDYANLSSTWVDIPAGNLSLRAVLDLAMNQHHLACDVLDGRLVITTEDASRDRKDLFVQVYPLPQPELASRTVEPQHWRELVTWTIAPADWDEVGGRGHCEAVPGGLLVVQPAAIQRQVRRLMDRVDGLASPPATFEPVPFVPPLNSPTERRIVAALEGTSSIDCHEKPLRELVEEIAQKHQIPVLLAFHRLQEEGCELDTPITKRLANVSLASILEQVLGDLDLAYEIRHECLLITTQDDAQSHLAIVAHPVHDLLALPDCQLGDFYPNPVVNLLLEHVDPPSWDVNGGPASVGVVLDGWLIVCQTWPAHREIEQLLAALRRGLAADSHPFVLRPGPASAARERVLAALDRPIQLDCGEISLSKFADRLSEELQIAVVLDAGELKASGLNPSNVVHAHLPPAPLRTQLGIGLRDWDLAWVVRRDLVQITTNVEPPALSTAIFDTRLLLEPQLGLFRPDQLKDAVTRLIAPDWWHETGGPGSLTAFGNLLIVSNTEPVLKAVEQFLAALEEHCVRRVAEPHSQEPAVLVVGQTEAQRRIEAALGAPTEFRLHGAPLPKAVAQLAASAAVPVFVSPRDLSDVDVTDETLASLSGRSQPLGQAFDRILAPHGLTTVIEDNLLCVTLQHEAWKMPEVRLYRIADLAGDKQAQGDLVAELKSLDRGGWLNPGSWEDQGGPVAVHGIDARWLAVSAPWQAHWRIEDWLSEKRTGQVPERELAARQLDEALAMGQEMKRQRDDQAIIDSLRADSPGPPPDEPLEEPRKEPQ